MKIETLLNLVSKVTDIPVSDIKSKSRKREVVTARHTFCYACQNMPHLFSKPVSLVSIGDIINRGHATVIYSVKQFESFLEHEKEIQELYRKLQIETANIKQTDEVDDLFTNEVIRRMRSSNNHQFREIIREMKIFGNA